jgi:hypothetical protein
MSLVLVFFFLAAAAQQVARLDGPFLVADDSAIRLDLHTANPLYHTRVVRVTACSAVDRPFLADLGCQSPGFTSTVIYDGASGSLASKWRVRQSARSLFVRRRLVTKFSPVVHLEVRVEVQNERSVTEGEQVLTARFIVPERSVSTTMTTEEEVVKAPPPEGLLGSIVHLREDKDEEDPLVNATDISYSRFTGYHWAEYSLTILCGFALLVSLVALGIYRGTKKAKRQVKRLGTDYAEKREHEDGAVIAGWMASAIGRGLFGSRRRRDGQDNEYKSIV